MIAIDLIFFVLFSILSIANLYYAVKAYKNNSDFIGSIFLLTAVLGILGALFICDRYLRFGV